MTDQPDYWRSLEADAAAWERRDTPAPLAIGTIDPATWAGIEPPERRWTLPDWLPEGHAAYLTGAGGTGKSLLAQVLCTCIALGLPFLGVQVEPRKALYLTCEDDVDELHRRQTAICAGLGVDIGDLSGKLLLASRFGHVDNAVAAFERDGTMNETSTWSSIRHTVEREGIGFVVLDNVAHLFAGNENARTEVTTFASMLGALAKRIAGTVLLIGHPNKNGDEYSGSTAWENAFRARLYLKPHTGEDGTEDPGARELLRPKSNYAEKGAAIVMRWHAGTFMLEQDIPESVGAQLREVSVAQAENDAFLRCLAKATKDRRAVSHVPGVNYAPKVFAGMIEGKGTKEEGFARALERLLHTEAIELDQPLWKGENRHWKQGIRLAPTRAYPSAKSLKTLASTPAPTPCADPAPTLRQPLRKSLKTLAPTLRQPPALTPLHILRICQAGPLKPPRLTYPTGAPRPTTNSIGRQMGRQTHDAGQHSAADRPRPFPPLPRLARPRTVLREPGRAAPTHAATGKGIGGNPWLSGPTTPPHGRSCAGRSSTATRSARIAPSKGDRWSWPTRSTIAPRYRKAARPSRTWTNSPAFAIPATPARRPEAPRLVQPGQPVNARDAHQTAHPSTQLTRGTAATAGCHGR